MGFLESLLDSPFFCKSCSIVAEKSVNNELGFTVISYYDYGPNFRSLLLRYKEASDIFLAPVFLHAILIELKLKYAKYTFICAPSRAESLSKRGFMHLELMLEVYGFKTLDYFVNESPIDQTQSPYRPNIEKYIKIRNEIDLSDKNIVLFDDVMTSGSTLKVCHKLLKNKPKNLRVISLAKT